MIREYHCTNESRILIVSMQHQRCRVRRHMSAMKKKSFVKSYIDAKAYRILLQMNRHYIRFSTQRSLQRQMLHGYWHGSAMKNQSYFSKYIQ